MSTVNDELKLVIVDNTKVGLTRYQKDDIAIAKQKQAIDDLIKSIDETPRIPSNALVLEAYAKTLTTLKNKIDKQRKALKDALNREGEEVHKFYNTTFVKPLEEKINSLKKEVEQLTQPMEVDIIEDNNAIVNEIHTIQVKCDIVILTKILSFLKDLQVEHNVI